MNTINLIKYNYKLSTRNYTVSKNNNFKIPSIGLIQSFKVTNFNELNEKYKKLKLKIIIGNFSIVPSILFNVENEDVLNIKEIRNYIRNIDFPESDYENQLINFEHFLFSQQLKCTEHYYTIKNKDLQNSIFTSGINVYIEIISENNEEITEELYIEETFWDKIYEDKKVQQ